MSSWSRRGPDMLWRLQRLHPAQRGRLERGDGPADHGPRQARGAAPPIAPPATSWFPGPYAFTEPPRCCRDYVGSNAHEYLLDAQERSGAIWTTVERERACLEGRFFENISPLGGLGGVGCSDGFGCLPWKHSQPTYRRNDWRGPSWLRIFASGGSLYAAIPTRLSPLGGRAPSKVIC